MELNELTKRLTLALSEKAYTICTAEECTCGLLGATIASQDYSQRWYRGTITVYTEDEAVKVLGVTPKVTRRTDFVSCQVALQMALKALSLFDTNIAVSIIGYVDGYGSSDVPSGEVQICVAKSVDKSTSFKYKKIHVNGGQRGKNLEVVIDETLRAILEHVMS